MSIFALGINHKTAPVELRERVAFSPEAVVGALQDALSKTNLSEIVILSTCNRTELYCSGEETNAEEVLHWLAEFHDYAYSTLSQYIYHHKDIDAVQHLMRVSSGLDSLVLGEPQILGQIKQAYGVARSAGTVAVMLERLFQRSFSVAKQVRTETEIGASAVSVAFAAVNLSKHIFGALDKVKVLLVGAGETIELVARHMIEYGVTELVVANRTIARAEELAANLPVKASVLSLAQLPNAMPETDIVISSTASTLPIIGKGMVEQALKKRKYRPMFFVDLAVPRDVEAQVADLSDAYLYTVDDLQQIVMQNMEARQQAAEQAEQIVIGRSEEFESRLRGLQGVNLIKEYRQNNEEIRDELVRKSLAQIEAGKSAESVIAELANKLTNRIIHQPTQALSKASQQGDIQTLETIKEVLGIKSS